MINLRSRWWTAFRIVCSGAALLWVLHATPLRVIVSALHATDPPWLMIGLLLCLLTRLAAAERTQAISKALGLHVSRWQTIETLFISNFYALLSPGPVLSGVVTIYRYKNYGVTIPGGAGLMLASRAMECAMFIALGTACVLMEQRIALVTVRYPLLLAAGALLVTCVGIAGWWLMHKHWLRVRPLEPIVDASFFSQLRAVWHEYMIRGPRMALRASLPAALQVVLSGAALGVLGRALGLELSLPTSIWLSAAVYCVVLLPVSVAGLGVREVTLVKTLGMLGIAPQLAIALSVLLFLDPLINAMIGAVLQLRSTVRDGRSRTRESQSSS